VVFKRNWKRRTDAAVTLVRSRNATGYKVRRICCCCGLRRNAINELQEPKKMLQKLTGPVHELAFASLALLPDGPGSDAQPASKATVAVASSTPLLRRAVWSSVRSA
jgi:hypothetical protein